MTQACPLPSHNPSKQEIRSLLERVKRIAVVGLSDKPDRDSYVVAKYMLQHGYEVIPVNPCVREVLGRSSYASLEQVPGVIDLVNIFRRSEAVPEIVEAAIKIKAGAVWMQLGVMHEEAARTAEAAGLLVVQGKCLKVEHARLL